MPYYCSSGKIVLTECNLQNVSAFIRKKDVVSDLVFLRIKWVVLHNRETNIACYFPAGHNRILAKG